MIDEAETFEDTIMAATTTDALVALIDAYCLANGLPCQSADELLLKVLERINDLRNHAEWLQAFIDQWEAVQAREDTEAECKRNGHRDTGRGVCAHCETFI